MDKRGHLQGIDLSNETVLRLRTEPRVQQMRVQGDPVDIMLIFPDKCVYFSVSPLLCNVSDSSFRLQGFMGVVYFYETLKTRPQCFNILTVN